MEFELDRTERRIIGVLIEKELTTPDRYPMTVNALTTGCNQKNNRDPIMTLADFEVEGALRNLFVRGWATNSTDGGRLVKWKHRVSDKLGVTATEAAVLAELLLRGPQQPGELRTRAHRMQSLPTQGDLMEVVEGLMAKTPPLVVCLGRRDGERANRYGQTLAEDAASPVAEPEPLPPSAASTDGAVAPPPPIENPGPAADRLDALEERVAALEEALRALREELG